MGVDCEMLTVTRGESISEGERITKVWNQVVAGKVKETEVAGLIKKIKDNKWNYTGSFYSVYFRVDTPITIHEFGFYGPFKEPKAQYFVHLEIFEPKDKNQVMPLSWESPLIAKRKLNVLALKDELFFVMLEQGLQIQAHTWYLIQFMLDGPATIRCESIKSGVVVERPEGIIAFEFNKGSNQMPCIKFTVDPGRSDLNFYNSKL